MLGLALGICPLAFGFALKNHTSVPEVDPSLAIGGLTLLAGTIAVLRIRRKK
jgi:LPXTG-motif cell wall-anchored protein